MMKSPRILSLSWVALEIFVLGDIFAGTVGAFQVQRRNSLVQSPIATNVKRMNPLERFSVSNSQQQSASASSSDRISVVDDQARKWKAEAERIRLEAEQMDSALTLAKIEALEKKLSNEAWLEKNPTEVANIQTQLQLLNDKIYGKQTTASTSTREIATNGSADTNAIANKPLETTDGTESASSSTSKISTKDNASKEATDKYLLEENPLCGYDQEDLDLYNPVVEAIVERLPDNATIQEQLEAFRADPQLQEHFQEKIRKLIVEPMEDMQRLERLKQEYLQSNSSIERKQMKREIDQLEKTMEDDSPFVYSDSILLENLPVLSEEEVQQRLEAVGALHPILQALYKKRCGVDETGDLRLAIELDHFEPQVQLLEQVRSIEATTEIRHEIRLAILSLPVSVRNHFAESLNLEDGEDITAMIEALVDAEQEEWMSLSDIVISSSDDSSSDSDDPIKQLAMNLPEYGDLDFRDRSRFVQELLPSLTRLEIIHPSMEDIDLLMKEVLDQKAYMVTSKPERVIGGYYIRGRNEFTDFENYNNDKLVSFLQERLKKSSLNDKIDLFYIQDPNPPTDEEYELGELDRPVLVATAKNREQLYNWVSPVTKTAISLLGIASVLLFGAATTEMQPLMRDQLDAAVAGDTSIDLAPILSRISQVTASVLALQLVHELGHRVIAWKDKVSWTNLRCIKLRYQAHLYLHFSFFPQFDIGLPTLVPSIQLGLQGAITPLRSPPPSNKSLFDFAMAGPLVGMLASVVLLIAGMEISTSMDMVAANQLPAFPIAILKSSTLGGGIVEFFVGKGTLMSSSADSVLPLHPLAIAGFVGMFSNALALLPIGNTDGGRVSQVMFGRRGAYLVSVFTLLLSCVLGLCGLDDQRILLVYILFAMVWQREPESPALNEVDDLDFQRGLLGIAASVLVFLTLLPML